MVKSVLVAFLCLCAIAILSVWGCAPTHAQSASTGSIDVTGEAEIRVPPDEVIMVLGVETWDKDMQRAKTANDDRIRRVLAVTKDYGVEPKYVQTDQISVEPQYRNGTYTADDFIGYFVRKSVVITLKDVSKFEDLFTAAIGAGVTHVQGVQFRTTELRKYRDQARALAIQAAKEKAVALTGAVGRTVGQSRSIREDYIGWSYPYGSRWGASMSQNVIQNSASTSGTLFDEEGTFAPGQISVTARVSVTFGTE